jgi:3-mercaptopyruvate sulfurtransferase SseA
MGAITSCCAETRDEPDSDKIDFLYFQDIQDQEKEGQIEWTKLDCSHDVADSTNEKVCALDEYKY